MNPADLGLNQPLNYMQDLFPKGVGSMNRAYKSLCVFPTLVDIQVTYLIILFSDGHLFVCTNTRMLVAAVGRIKTQLLM